MSWIGRWIVGLGLLGASAGCMEDARCDKDYDCPSTEVCNVGTGECEPIRCEVDDDCAQPDERCEENACVSGG